MVGVVQLVEHRIVVPSVEGSSPFAHPRTGGRAEASASALLHFIMGCSQAVKARDFDSRIAGSSPAIPARSAEWRPAEGLTTERSEILERGNALRRNFAKSEELEAEAP